MLNHKLLARLFFPHLPMYGEQLVGELLVKYEEKEERVLEGTRANILIIDDPLIIRDELGNLL